MLESGEDPKFIARRMVIFASEDIGLAQPTALVVANAVFQAVTTIGMPECIHNLAHGVGFLANAAKDRSATNAIGEAMEDAKKLGNLPVPMKIRNAPTKLLKELGYGKGYQYDPDAEDGFSGANYFPEGMDRRTFYDPPGEGHEAKVRERLERWAELRAQKS